MSEINNSTPQPAGGQPAGTPPQGGDAKNPAANIIQQIAEAVEEEVTEEAGEAIEQVEEVAEEFAENMEDLFGDVAEMFEAADVDLEELFGGKKDKKKIGDDRGKAKLGTGPQQLDGEADTVIDGIGTSVFNPVTQTGGSDGEGGDTGDVSEEPYKGDTPNLDHAHEAEISKTDGGALSLGLAAPIMIALITGLLQEVAQMMREVLEGEATMKGKLGKLIVETGKAAAEAQFNATMKQAESLRAEAQMHMVNGVIGIVTAALTMGAFASAGRIPGTKTNRLRKQANTQRTQVATSKKRLDKARKQGTVLENKGKVDKDPEVTKKRVENNMDVKKRKKQLAEDEAALQKTDGEFTQARSAERQMLGQVVQSLNGSAQNFVQSAYKTIQAGIKEEEAAFQQTAALLNMMVQVLEKMYQGSQDSAQKATQMLNEIVQLFEKANQVLRGIGWGQP
ncbi:hypothetical protein SCG7086_AN_00170 [Chlamydiales bacterium SCGC AG-110-P3]|nr:hypothetical protein SCG7086_AN_00170 [Chlamydiales bacterium SCGC AG-110-P3]